MSDIPPPPIGPSRVPAWMVSLNPHSPPPAPATSPGLDTSNDMANQITRPERDARVYHQDYIARIRYSNALPPPPGPPKLLDIPTDGLEYYTSASFGSRLASQQPLNIEADAEMGMPIDLVGMPGIFDGDESSIQAPLVPPPVHPKDRDLLRPLSELGKPKYAPGGVSFLRRTEYISSEQTRSRVDPNTSRHSAKPNIKKRKPTDASRDEPVNVLRSTVKGFDIANPEDSYKGPDTDLNIRGAASTIAENDAWKAPKHPVKPELKVLDSYPVKPDLDAMTDTSAYMVAKFASNPTQSTDTRDTRMDVGLLHPIDPAPGPLAEYQAKIVSHEADPLHNPHPGGPPYSYNLFLPADEPTVKNIQKKMDPDDPERDDPKLYTKSDKDKHAHGRSFHYNQVRIYETGRQSINSDHPYQEVAVALHDSESKAENAPSDRSVKAAYYYPIIQKIQLKPRRNRNLAQLGLQLGLQSRDFNDEPDKIDAVDLVIRDPDEDEKAKRALHRAELDIEPGGEV